MGDEADYLRVARAAGFTPVGTEDLSRQVRRTWTICAARLAGKVATQPRYARYLMDRTAANRIFALTLARLVWPIRPALCGMG